MQFSALFCYMLWHIEFKFCIWLCFNVPQSKFECRHFASIFVGVMPLCELRILEIHSFPHFSLTCFDILSWNFAYDFVLLYYRSSSSVVNLRQCLWELCPFWNLEYWKYTVFRTFLLHPLTYWAESLHITLFFSVLQIKFEWYGDVRPSVRPSQFSALFSYMLWHIDLKFCVSLYFYVRKIKFEYHRFPSLFAGVMLLFNFKLLNLKLLQICSFPHFSATSFDILSSNFVYDFVLMYHRASLSVVILLQFLLELCLYVNLEYSKYTVFRTFLLHALTYWAEILHMTLFYCTTDQVRVSSICVNVCGSYAPFGT